MRSVGCEESGIEESRAATAAGAHGARCVDQAAQLRAAVRTARIEQRAAGGAHDGNRGVAARGTLAANGADDAVRIPELRRAGAPRLVERVRDPDQDGPGRRGCLRQFRLSFRG